MIINGKEIEINRKNAVISEVDSAYMALVEKILTEGVKTNNRTGIDTLSIANWNYVFDLSKGFPILETKLVNIKSAVNEIQWIHQVQSNKVKWLQDRDNHTWDLWVVDEDGIYRVYEQGENAIDDPYRLVPLTFQARNPQTGVIEKLPYLDESGNQIMVASLDVMQNLDNPRTIKEAIFFGKEYAGTIGEAYGFINQTYKRPQCAEWTMKNNPTDRRININLWQDFHIPKAVLPSCVYLIEFKITPDGKLHAAVNQRSADTPAGVPFNIPQYAVLINQYAKTNNLQLGTMSWHITDAHIYVNQIEKIKKQLQRYKYMVEYSNIIQTSSDEEIERLYNSLSDLYDKIDLRVRQYTDIYGEKTIGKRVEKLIKTNDESAIKLAIDYQEAFERKLSLEHMLTRETPVLELASHDSIFEYSTDYVKKGDKYLEENPIGNKELVLKNYHPTPFIGMPIAQ